MDFLESFKTLPLLAPADGATASTGSYYIDTQLAEGRILLGVQFGAISSSDSTGGLDVTVEASTASSSNATEVPIPFRYRLSSAVDTDSWGAPADASTTGVNIVSTDYANCMLLIQVDPSVLAELGADYRYIRTFFTANTVTAYFRSVFSMFLPRYAGVSIPSST